MRIRLFITGISKSCTFPYFPSYDNGKKGFIPYDVLFQLSHIFKYMNIHNLQEFDYREFNIVNTDLNKKSDKKRVNEKFTDEREMFIKYALKKWIDNYFEMKVRANTPKTCMDKMDNRSNETNYAREWLDFFHSKLNRLPELHREIIEKKYLKIQVPGRYVIDDFVYGELHIARSLYYVRKKEGLYWLGLALWNYQSDKGTNLKPS